MHCSMVATRARLLFLDIAADVIRRRDQLLRPMAVAPGR
jgi:hypothetical protein